jgi:hypothetical protein
MSTLRQAAEDYLAIRRSLGFKLVAEGYLLHSFAGYAEQAGASRLTVDLALDWAGLPTGQDPVWCAKRLAVVRGFARHLQTLDPATEESVRFFVRGGFLLPGTGCLSGVFRLHYLELFCPVYARPFGKRTYRHQPGLMLRVPTSGNAPGICCLILIGSPGGFPFCH